MKCLFCGHEIPDNSAFCKECGRPTSQQQKSVNSSAPAQGYIPTTPAAPPRISVQPYVPIQENTPVNTPVNNNNSPKKTNVVPIIIISAAAGTVILGIVITLIILFSTGIIKFAGADGLQSSVPEISKGYDESSENMFIESSAELESEKESESTESSGESEEASEYSVESKESYTKSKSAEESKRAEKSNTVEESKREQSSTVKPESKSVEEKSNTVTDYNATELPTVSDFTFLAGAGSLVTGDIPTGGKALTVFDDIKGLWKCHTKDPTSDGYLLCICEIAGSADNAQLIIQPVSSHYNGEAPEDMTDIEPTVYKGTFSDGVFWVASSSLGIKSDALFIYDNKQYFIGKTILQSGETAEFYMVRP